MLSRASMMMTSLETLKTSFALDIKLFEESVSRDIGTEGRRDTHTYMYTYDIQYVDFRTDQLKEMGQVDAAGAVQAFRSFPFKEQLEKAKGLSEPTFLTISFRSHHDGAILALWSLEPNIYEIYLMSGHFL